VLPMTYRDREHVLSLRHGGQSAAADLGVADDPMAIRATTRNPERVSLIHRCLFWFAKRPKRPTVHIDIDTVDLNSKRPFGWEGMPSRQDTSGSRVIGADSGVSRAGKTFREHVAVSVIAASARQASTGQKLDGLREHEPSLSAWSIPVGRENDDDPSRQQSKEDRHDKCEDPPLRRCQREA